MPSENQNRISAPPLAASASDVEAIEPVARVAVWLPLEVIDEITHPTISANLLAEMHYAKELIAACQAATATEPDVVDAPAWPSPLIVCGTVRESSVSSKDVRLVVEHDYSRFELDRLPHWNDEVVISVAATRADHAQSTTTDAISEAAINNNPSTDENTNFINDSDAVVDRLAGDEGKNR